MASRKYTQQDYDDAIRRISALIDLEKIENMRELNNKLKEKEVYYDIRGGNQTIYEQLRQNWYDFVKPEVQIEQEREVRIARRKPVLSKAERYKRQRELVEIQGTAWLDREGRLKRREGRQYIVHKGSTFKADNIVIYQNKKTFKWITRRKPIRIKKRRRRR